MGFVLYVRTEDVLRPGGLFLVCHFFPPFLLISCSYSTRAAVFKFTGEVKYYEMFVEKKIFGRVFVGHEPYFSLWEANIHIARLSKLTL